MDGESLTALRTGAASGLATALFKSVGNAVQDLSAASRALRRAEELGLGVEIPL